MMDPSPQKMEIQLSANRSPHKNNKQVKTNGMKNTSNNYGIVS